jgi:hypothetical protein
MRVSTGSLSIKDPTTRTQRPPQRKRSLLATSINKLKNSTLCLIECTLQMITKNFEDFPEHHVNFFKLRKL